MSLDNIWGASPLMFALVPFSSESECISSLTYAAFGMTAGTIGFGTVGISLKRLAGTRKPGQEQPKP